MTVKITKPALNLREELADLRKPSGIAGEALLRADSVQEQRDLIGAGRKNLIINGGFDVWQRGTSFSGNNIYTADRWLTINGTTSSITKQGNGFHWNDTVGTSPTASGIEQRIENLHRYVGSIGSLTVSFKLTVNRANSGTTKFYMWDYDGSNYVSGSEYVLPENSGTYSHTFTVSGASDGDVFTCSFWLGNGDYILENVQLELGSVATEFEHRSYGEELALCQRYYYKTDTIRYLNLGRYNNNTGAGLAWWSHPVRMRAAPTMATTGTWNAGTGYSGVLAYGAESSDGCQVYSSVNIGANQMVYAHGASITADAEL
jgi:hypothetical protein